MSTSVLVGVDIGTSSAKGAAYDPDRLGADEITMPARITAVADTFEAAKAAADAVRVTLGPKSKCVLIEKKWGTPLVCNDGVTIAKEFELENPEENLGAQMIRQAAERLSTTVPHRDAAPFTTDPLGDATVIIEYLTVTSEEKR